MRSGTSCELGRLELGRFEPRRLLSWDDLFWDIQPNIQQNTIPKLKGAILNAAEMTCRKVNKPGCATR